MSRQTLELVFSSSDEWQVALNRLHGFLRTTGIRDIGVSFDLDRQHTVLRLVASADSMIKLIANQSFSWCMRNAKKVEAQELPKHYKSMVVKRNRVYERITEAQAPKVLERRFERALKNGYFSPEYVVEQQRLVFGQLADKKDFKGPTIMYKKNGGKAYTIFLDLAPAEEEKFEEFSSYGFCLKGTVPVW